MAIVVYFIASLPMLFVDTYLNAVIVSIFMGVGFGGMLYFIYLIIADVIDEDELRTGVRREGTFFGVTNFFMRLAMVLSILTVGLVFSSTGWEEYDPLPGVNVILGLRYPFTKERVQEIKKELDTLHKDKLNKVRSRSD
jgi:GPH family glycoside/pentoside/hexuronide:cation symporter